VEYPSIDQILNKSEPTIRSAVYFLVDADKVVYIGQSKNVLQRLGAHFRSEEMEFDSYCFLAVPVDDLDTVEYGLIRKYSPKYNIQRYPNGPKHPGKWYPKSHIPRFAKPRSSYVNRHEVSYQEKLTQIKIDIKSGKLEKLSLVIGRDRYKMNDPRTRRAQKELVKAGFLEKNGRTYVAPISHYPRSQNPYTYDMIVSRPKAGEISCH